MEPKGRRISVTDSARNFADLVNRAYYRGETALLVRNGVPVAHLVPVGPVGIPAGEALARWRLRRPLEHENAEAMARDIRKGRAAVRALGNPWR